MKKVEIGGVCKVYGTKEINGTYANIEVNGVQIENLIADHMLEKEDGSYLRETALCRVSITIEPHIETLTVNGQTMSLEL